MADFSLATQIQPVKLPDPIQQYAQFNQLALHQAQLAEYQRSQGEQNQLRRFLASGGNPYSPEGLKVVGQIAPGLFNTFVKEKEAMETSEVARRVQEGVIRAQNDTQRVQEGVVAAQKDTSAAAQRTAAVANVDMLARRLTTINALPPEQRDAQYAIFRQGAIEQVPGWGAHLSPTYDEKTAREQAMTATEAVKAHADREAAQQTEINLRTRLVYTSPTATQPGTVFNPRTNQLNIAGTDTPFDFAANQAAIQEANLANFGKQKRIERDIGAELNPVQEQKLRTEHGEALASANQGLDSAQGALDAAKALRAVPDADKGRILGFINSNLANPTDAAKGAQTKFNDVKGQITAMAKGQLGSIGSMAVQEWQIIANQIATLEAKNLTPALLNEQLDIIIARADNLLRKTRSNYNATYGPMTAKHGKEFELGTPSPRGAANKISNDAIDTANPHLN
jgi:hypothetical protein